MSGLCDGTPAGAPGPSNYNLLWRDVAAAYLEIVARANRFDAVAFICVCNGVVSEGGIPVMMQAEERLPRLQEALRVEGFAAAIILQRADVYYYSGTGQPCILLVPATGEPVLFVRRAFEMARRATWVRNVRDRGSFEAVKGVLEESGIRDGIVGIEQDVLPARIYLRLKALLPQFEFRDVSPLILRQRSKKDPQEIGLIRTAGHIFHEVHKSILSRLAEGVSDLEVAADILSTLRRHGAESVTLQRRWDAHLPLDGFVVGGSQNLGTISGYAMTVTGRGTSEIIPWGASGYRFKKGDLLVVDLPVNYRGYHYDGARTYVVGHPSEEQERFFRILSDIQQAVLAALKPGARVKSLWRIAEDRARQAGISGFFMGYGAQQGKYVGHGIGLESNEWPLIAPDEEAEVVEGNVFSVEPKVIIPGWGAMALEDTVAVMEYGYERLSPVEPKLFGTG